MITEQTMGTHRGFTPSPLHKISYRAGYQLGRLDHLADWIKKKLKIVKWGARVVNFWGIETSARLGWKGLKLKRKLDQLKKD